MDTAEGRSETRSSAAEDAAGPVMSGPLRTGAVAVNVKIGEWIYYTRASAIF